MRFVNLYRAILFIAVILLWQYLANRYGVSVKLVASSPTAIWASFKIQVLEAKDPLLYKDLKITLYEIGVAYALTSIIGVSVGLGIGISKFIGRSLHPLVIAFFSIPGVVLYPIIYLSLGLGTNSKILFAILISLYTIIENSKAGVEQVPKDLNVLGRSLGMNIGQILRKITIPGALPLIVNGLKLGLSFSIIGVVAGEFIASYGGLGNLLIIEMDNIQISSMFVIIFIILIVATSGNVALSYLEKYLNRYRLS